MNLLSANAGTVECRISFFNKRLMIQLFLLMGLLFPCFTAAQDHEILEYYGSTWEGVIHYFYYLDGEGNQVTHGRYETFFTNGQLWEEVEYVDGKREGTYRSYYQTGELHTTSEYVDGKRTGTAYEYYENGQINHETPYENDLLNGTSRFYYDDGQLWTESSYVNGVKEGAVRQYYPNGLLYFEYFMKDGLKNGRYRSWRIVDDQRLIEKDYEYKDDVKDGPYEEWGTTLDTDGTLYHSSHRQSAYKNGSTPNGYYLEEYWRAPGKLSSRYEIYYSDALANGQSHSVRYNSAGSPWDEVTQTYRNGFKLEGEETHYLSDGSYYTFTTLYGLENGTYKEVRADGSIATQREYTYGKLDGLVQHFRTDGTLQYSTEYENGKKQGWYTTYTTGGAVYEKTYYTYGKMHGAFYHYGTASYDNVTVGQYSNGQKCGIWTTTKNSDGTVTTVDYGSPEPMEIPEEYLYSGEVYGHAQDEFGNPVENVTLNIGGVSVQSDSYGNFTASVESKEPVIAVSGGGSTSGMIALKSGSVNILIPSKEPTIQIHSAPTANSYFFEGIPAPAPLNIGVNWNSPDTTNGWISVSANGQSAAIFNSSSSDEWEFTIDPASYPFAGTTRPDRNRVEIYAELGGKKSQKETLQYHVIPVPTWLNSVNGTIKSDNNSRYGKTTYQISGAFPQKPIELKISQETLPSWAWSAWSYIPFIGGKSFGLKSTQAKLEGEVTSDGSASLSLSGVNGFEAAGTEIEGKIGGKGNLKLSALNGLEFTGGSLVFGLDGKIERSENIGTVFPALKKAESIAVAGRAISRFNQMAKVAASVYVGGDATLDIVNQDGGLELSAATLGMKTGLNIGLILDLISDKLKAEVRGGGETLISWQVPPNPDYLKDLESKVYASLSVSVWRWEKVFHIEEGLKLSDPPDEPSLQTASFEWTEEEDWSLMPIPARYSSLSRQAVSCLESNVCVLMENVYSHPELAAAFGSETSAVALVSLDAGLPSEQATDIYRFEFAAPDPIPVNAGLLEDNTQAEFAPKLTFDSEGHLLTAFEQINAASGSVTNIEDFATALEIALSVDDNPILTLTDNHYLDHSPAWIVGTDQTVWLCWQSSISNQLFASESEPIEIHVRPWNAQTGLLDAELPTLSLTNMIQYAPAASSGGIELLCVVDMDGDDATSDDTEIMQWSLRSDGWHAPVRLTDNNLPDLYIKANTGPDGTAVFWMQDDTIVYYDKQQIRSTGLTPQTPETFRAATDPATGRAVLCWQEASPTGTVLTASVMDNEYHAWSEPFSLYDALRSAHDVQLGFQENQLLALFAGDLVSTNYTVEQTDICITETELGVDPSISFPSLSILPINPEPGSIVTARCEVANGGLLAISNLTVSCALGTESNLTEAATLFYTGLIPGLGSETIEWQLTAPISNQAPHILHWELDGENAVSEMNESNNTAQISLFPPDLTPGDYLFLPSIIPSRYTLITRVENRGTGVSAPCYAGIRIDGMDQGVSVIPEIEAGGFYEWESRIQLGTDSSGEAAEIVLTLDTQDELAESCETNNTASFTFSGLSTSDDDADGLPDVWEQYYHQTLDYGPDDDVDGDGYSESVEWRQQMDPTVADAPAFIRILPPMDGTAPGIQWQALEQIGYDIYCTTNLVNGEGWRYRGTVHGHGEVESFGPQTRSDADSPTLFFRIEMQ